MKKNTENTKTVSLKREILWYIMFLLLVLVGIFLIFLSLIIYIPAEYQPAVYDDPNQISPLLTNKILPEIYNNSQLGENFEVELSENQINEMIGTIDIKLDKIKLKLPCVYLRDGLIRVMVSTSIGRIETVISADFQVEKNYLALKKIKMGRLPCTRLIKTKLAKTAAGGELFKDKKLNEFIRKMLQDRAEITPFEIDNNWIRVENITASERKIKILFKPIGRKKSA